MKRAFVILLLVLMVRAVSGGQHNGKLLKVPDSKSAVKGGSVDQLLIEMEREWARAIIAGDAEKIRRILAPEIVLTTPEGTVLNREDDLAELAKGEFKADVFEPGDMNVKLYGICAVVTGHTTVKGKYKGKDVEDQFRWTDTFVKRKGKWQIVASQATAIPKTIQR